MDSEEKQKRKDDGASRAYRRMGRTEYERYAKDMAQIWWDIPPTVEKSGLFMETSKLRIRGQPRYEWHNRILMDSCPQPDYTLKVSLSNLQGKFGKFLTFLFTFLLIVSLK